MNMRDLIPNHLIPWGRPNPRAPAYYREVEQHPVLALHREMNRLFDDVFRAFDAPFGGMSSWHSAWPKVEISETDKELRILAEVPGMDEKDIDLLLEDGMLILRGEKKEDFEDKGRQFSERFYGRFERRLPLPYEVQEDKAEADFKNGLLTVTLPKSAKAQPKGKRIAINGRH